MPVTPQGRSGLEDARATDRVSARQETRRLERPSRSRISNDGPFSLDFNRIPKGFVLEWKRHTLMGMEDKHNQVIVRQNHWTPVPHKDQPHILGHLCKDPEEHIVVAGLGLYMRPEYLNEDANCEQRESTDFMVREQLQALRLQSREQVGDRYTKIKKAVVSVQAVE